MRWRPAWRPSSASCGRSRPAGRSISPRSPHPLRQLGVLLRSRAASLRRRHRLHPTLLLATAPPSGNSALRSAIVRA